MKSARRSYNPYASGSEFRVAPVSKNVLEEASYGNVPPQAAGADPMYDEAGHTETDDGRSQPPAQHTGEISDSPVYDNPPTEWLCLRMCNNKHSQENYADLSVMFTIPRPLMVPAWYRSSETIRLFRFSFWSREMIEKLLFLDVCH